MKTYNAPAMPDTAETALSATLASVRVRVTRVLPAQVRKAVETLSDEELWWRPNETSNSAGNLVLHLAGSLNEYLNRRIGGIDYSRDRDAEFAERRHLPRDEVLRIFDDMVEKAERTFDSLTLERLGDPSTDPERYTLLVEELINVLTHIANHTGQIVWIAKMLHDGAIRETWMKSHKHEGGWRPA
jgi:uncharacterized damage-inducible protein DinB